MFSFSSFFFDFLVFLVLTTVVVDSPPPADDDDFFLTVLRSEVVSDTISGYQKIQRETLFLISCMYNKYKL